MLDPDSSRIERRHRAGRALAIGVCGTIVAAELVIGMVSATRLDPSAGRSGSVGVSVRGEPVEVLQFNMCGAVNDAAKPGCVSHGESGDGTAVPAVVALILDTRADARRPGRPDIVTLNEACEPQVDAILSALRAAGYPMDGRFVTTQRAEPRCAGDADFGNAVLTREPITDGPDDVIAFPLPDPDGGEVRTLLCVDTRLAAVPIKACSVHLSNILGKQTEQAAEVARVVDGFLDAGTPVIVGGDFNAPPADDALDLMYSHTGGSGQFREVDDTDSAFYFTYPCNPLIQHECRSGEPSAGPAAKIDYIFVSDHFAGAEGDVLPAAASDHGPLRGSAILVAAG